MMIDLLEAVSAVGMDIKVSFDPQEAKHVIYLETNPIFQKSGQIDLSGPVGCGSDLPSAMIALAEAVERENKNGAAWFAAAVRHTVKEYHEAGYALN